MLTAGVLLDSAEQEGWVLDALRRVSALPVVTLGPVVVATPEGGIPPVSAARRLLDRADHLMRTRGEDYFRRVDIVRSLQLRQTTMRLQPSGEDWYFDAARCRILQKAGVDLWLCVGRRPARFASSDIAPRGAWCIELGDGFPAANPAAGSAELVSRCPVTAVSVVDRTVPGRGRLLMRGYSSTVMNSVRRNRYNALLKGSCYWHRLLEGRRQEVDTTLPADYPAGGWAGRPRAPRIAVALARRVFANQWRELFWRRQWQLAFTFSRGALQHGSAGAWHRLVPPRDRFWADPFALELDGRHYILFEELRYSDWKGRLMAVEVFEDGRHGQPEQMLERDWHLSYPFVFRWRDGLWMIPESAENGRVELYRCERFPQDWRLEKVLLDGVKAYDATLAEQDGRWWMFVSIAPPGAQDGDELHLYHADAPIGPWTPHRDNPVMSDARYARPAGPLFRRNGSLYRPSQDCAPDYGYAVNLNRVDQLDKDAYRETPVDRIPPSLMQHAHCLHTLGRHGRLRVLDYEVWRRRL